MATRFGHAGPHPPEEEHQPGGGETPAPDQPPAHVHAKTPAQMHQERRDKARMVAGKPPEIAAAELETAVLNETLAAIVEKLPAQAASTVAAQLKRIQNTRGDDRPLPGAHVLYQYGHEQPEHYAAVVLFTQENATSDTPALTSDHHAHLLVYTDEGTERLYDVLHDQDSEADLPETWRWPE